MLADRLQAHEWRELLEKPGFVTSEEWQQAVAEAQHSGKSLPAIILEKSYLTTQELTRLAAEHFHLPFVQLGNLPIAVEVINQIPELVARQQRAVAFGSDAGGLKVALADPLDSTAVEAVKKVTDRPIVVCAATEDDLAAALDRYPHQYLDTIKSLATSAIKDGGDGSRITEGIVKLFETLVTFALVNRASDVHLEPYEDRFLVRYRVDGVLHHVIDLPQATGLALVNRVKVLAKMKLDVRNAAQDGKLKF